MIGLRWLARGWPGRAAALCAALFAALFIAGCASARFDVPRVPSQAFDQPLQTSLGQGYWPKLAAAPGQSGFHLLVSGPEAFAARGALAEAAQRTLDLQCYSVAHDPTTTLLMDAALRAAQRGGRVRLLVDDLNVGQHESDLALLAWHPNIEVRLFNPFSARGGFGLSQALRFRDSDYMRQLRSTAFGGLVRTGQVSMVVAPAQALHDRPANTPAASTEPTSAIFPVLRQLVENARFDVILVSPYFVPGERGVSVLCGLVQRGVRVSVLTNSLASTDVPVVHAGYARHRPQLLACGVALHELRPGAKGDRHSRIGLSSGASLHTEAVVVDGETVFIGSMNLDPRSRYLNSEAALRIDSRELGRQVTTLLDEATTLDQAFRVELDAPGRANASLHWDTIVNGQPLHYTDEPLASAWRRMVSGVFGSLAPEGLL